MFRAAIVLFWLLTTSVCFPEGLVGACNDFSLRAALTGGGLVTFGVSGTIVLTNTLSITNDCIIDGSGQTVEISGNDSVRVFDVSPGVKCILLHISIIRGCTNAGAGVYNQGGSLLVSNCLFAGNTAIGAPGMNAIGTNSGTAGMPGSGGAICSIGTLDVFNSTFLTNRAVGGNGGSILSIDFEHGSATGDGAAGLGGAIYSIGVLGLESCIFTQNSAEGGNGGSSADADVVAPRNGAEGSGGAIYSVGYLGVSNSCFSLNSGTGGDAGTGGKAGWGGNPAHSLGGALFFSSDVRLVDSRISLVNCSFNGNFAKSGCNENPRNNRFRGSAEGGAFFSVGSKALILDCHMETNAINGSPATGGACHIGGGSLTISNSSFVGNTAVADRMTSYYNSNGSAASGGGLFADSADMLITHSLFASNEIRGGRSTFFPFQKADGGTASGAGMCSIGYGVYGGYIGNIRLTHCTFAGNIATGGIAESDYGGRGGNAYGAGAYFATPAQLLNCTFAGSTAQGGGVRPGDATSGGNAFGGGLYAERVPTLLTNCTLAENKALGGLGWSYYWNGNGYGGNVASVNTWVSMLNTILSGGTSTNAFGYIADRGHNISSDGSCALTLPTSYNNIDPKLLALENNGGLTPTMALLPDSPALDAGAAVAGLDVDQRGVPRPYGTAPDIGAYEWNATSFYKDFSLVLTRSNSHWAIRILGPGMTPFRLQKSLDFVNWSDISTNNSGLQGRLVLEDTEATDPARFYRVISP